MQQQDIILLVFVAGLFALMWNNGRKRKKAAAVKRHFKRVRSMQLPKKLY